MNNLDATLEVTANDRLFLDNMMRGLMSGETVVTDKWGFAHVGSDRDQFRIVDHMIIDTRKNSVHEALRRLVEFRRNAQQVVENYYAANHELRMETLFNEDTIYVWAYAANV